MPRGDGTGPQGLGPATGRGGGFCAGYAVPGYANFRPHCTFGSPGRGWRNRYYATGLTGWQRGGAGWTGQVPPVETPEGRELELATLKVQAENIARTLDSIRKQIELLETQSPKITEQGR